MITKDGKGWGGHRDVFPPSRMNAFPNGILRGHTCIDMAKNQQTGEIKSVLQVALVDNNNTQCGLGQSLRFTFPILIAEGRNFLWGYLLFFFSLQSTETCHSGSEWPGCLLAHSSCFPVMKHFVTLFQFFVWNTVAKSFLDMCTEMAKIKIGGENNSKKSLK